MHFVILIMLSFFIFHLRQMSHIQIDAQHLTIDSAEKLGESLRDYSGLVDVQFITAKGTDTEQVMMITGEKLHLHLETEELLSLVPRMNIGILVKVQ